MSRKLVKRARQYQASDRTSIRALGHEARFPLPADLDDSDFGALIASLAALEVAQDLPG